MKFLVVFATLAFTVSNIQAGVIPLTYNLISSPGLVHQQAVTFGHPAPGIISAPFHQDPSHPAVVENALAESQLSPDLINPFYKNPAIAAGLAKESWFTNKEFPVHHREADKISRGEIYKIINRIHHAHE